MFLRGVYMVIGMWSYTAVWCIQCLHEGFKMEATWYPVDEVNWGSMDRNTVKSYTLNTFNV